MKPKSARKISEDPGKVNSNVGASLLKEKRVFGTARNPNVPVKTATGKPGKAKPSSGLLKGAATSSPETRSPLSGQPISRTTNSSEKNPKKKNVCFPGKEIGSHGKVLEPQTPLKSAVASAKRRLPATPYRSAEKCRLETSATGSIISNWQSPRGSILFLLLSFNWLPSAKQRYFKFLHLRWNYLHNTPQPIRNIRVELKKYLSRHQHLNGEEVWEKVSFSYGLVKEESGQNEGNGKASDEEAKASCIQDQEDKDLQ
ncbi:UNVERIFIED_CONTAM: hypothetical protein Scaly_0370100 [Sesamum calycinum]|uniref:Uncharacterized protein n=1 Tax=Sesamum calycinum TaxID=2727403 RepID=A0AAW2SCB2_9LAMI